MTALCAESIRQTSAEARQRLCDALGSLADGSRSPWGRRSP